MVHAKRNEFFIAPHICCLKQITRDSSPTPQERAGGCGLCDDQSSMLTLLE